MNPTFDLLSGLPLAYAFVSQLAKTHNVRLLIIKGLQLSQQGLRGLQTPTDVDVLVHADDVAAMIDAFENRGWNRADVRDVPGVLPQHAVTLVHDGWPCAVDVHRYFPGFFASADVVFDTLWEVREEQTFAGQRVWGLPVSANAVIISLHHQRHIDSGRHAEQYSRTRNFAYTAEQIAEIDRLTRTTRCCEIVDDFRTHLGLDRISDLSKAEKQLWRHYQDTNEDGSTSAWLTMLFRTPWRQRPRLLASAVWPAAAEVRAEYAFPQGANVNAYRLRRILRGARALPSAVLSYLRFAWSTRRSTYPPNSRHAAAALTDDAVQGRSRTGATGARQQAADNFSPENPS